MKSYDKSIQKTTRPTLLATEAAPIVGMALVAIFVMSAIFLVGNVGALAGGIWTVKVMCNVTLVALAPWVLLIIGYAQELLVFAWPRLERATGRDLDGSGAIGDPRQPTVLTPDRMFFIETICRTGKWTQRDWRGIVLPSKLICDNDLHKSLIAPLEQAGVFAGRREGARGQMVVTDPSRIMEMLTVKN